MALVIRHDTIRSAGEAARKLPRPGRRAASLAVGLALTFVLVDAVVHPHTVVDLWTMQILRRLDAPALLPLFSSAAGSLIGSAAAFFAWMSLIAFGLMSLGMALGGRLSRRRRDTGRGVADTRRSYLEIARDPFSRPTADIRVLPPIQPAPVRFVPRCDSPSRAA